MLSCSTYQPSELLRNHVVRYWVTRGRQQGDLFVIPDAFPELVFHFDPRFCAEIEGVSYTGQAGGVFGQFSRSSLMRVKEGNHSLWIKLHPWTLPYLFDTPVCHMNDRVTGADELGDREFLQLTKTITQMDNIPRAISLIEAFLIRRIYRVNPGRNMIASVVQQIFQTKGRIGIERLAEDHGIGIRQLQYVFKQAVGFSPSYYRKQVRIKNISLHLANEKITGFASMAYEWGYTDQSHLIKDFKSIVQLTPAQYRRKIFKHDISLLDLELREDE